MKALKFLVENGVVSQSDLIQALFASGMSEKQQVLFAWHFLPNEGSKQMSVVLGEEYWSSYPIAGVGLIVVHDDPAKGPHVLTLQEERGKTELKKIKGSRSFPMETCKEGECVFESLGRLIEEELPGMRELVVEPNPAGLFEVVDGVWLLVWWATMHEPALPIIDPCMDVSDFRWEPLTALVNGYPNLRHGALEPLVARKNGQRVVRDPFAVH